MRTQYLFNEETSMTPLSQMPPPPPPGSLASTSRPVAFPVAAPPARVA
jgi:hypothetical protein